MIWYEADRNQNLKKCYSVQYYLVKLGHIKIIINIIHSYNIQQPYLEM